MKLVNKLVFRGEITVLTGLHIGGSKEQMGIGGVDSEVIKKPNGEPYIPGSSIKGKMRHLLELSEGLINGGKPHSGEGCNKNKCIICGLFGSEKQGQGRLIFRDLDLIKKAEGELETGYTEVKTENVVNRIRGTAEHPRQIERVPAGTKFNFEVVMNLFEEDDEEFFKNAFIKGLKLLENDYLGGSGTRGYGRVKFSNECFNPQEEGVV